MSRTGACARLATGRGDRAAARREDDAPVARLERSGALLRTVPVSSNQLPVTLGRFDRAGVLPTLGGLAKAENQAWELNFATQERKTSPRSSKFSNWSKLAQAGASNTISPGFALPAAVATACSSVPECS